MQILLLLLLFPLRGWWQIVVRTRPVVLQIVERQVRQLCWLYPQILESLRILVDHLIYTFLLCLVCRYRLPKEELVRVVCSELEDGLGHVDVPALLDDFSVDKLGDLGHGVVCGAVEFECLASGGVVIADFLESFAYVDRLRREWIRALLYTIELHMLT